MSGGDEGGGRQQSSTPRDIDRVQVSPSYMSITHLHNQEHLDPDKSQ